jgi:hypothetical protein
MAKSITVFNYTSGTSTAKIADSKQFTAKATSTKNAAATMRAGVQALIEAGLGHYAEHGDTVYLTKAMDCCIGVQALPTNTIKGYIKQHANVTYVKSGDVYVFQKVKAGKDEPKGTKVSAVVEMPTVTWFAYNAEKNPIKADYDAVTRLKNMIKGMEAALEDGKVKGDDTNLVSCVTTELKALMARIATGEFKNTAPANDAVETVEAVAS